MSSTCSVLPRDLVSVEVAAEQVGAHPQTLLTRSTFPVHYPVLAPERPQMANPRPTPKPEILSSALATGHQRQPCRLFPRPPPSELKMIVGSLGIPWGSRRQAMNRRPIRGWTKPLHECGMKAGSMPERLLIGPGSPHSIDPVYPELSPPPEPCRDYRHLPVRENPGYCPSCSVHVPTCGRPLTACGRNRRNRWRSKSRPSAA